MSILHKNANTRLGTLLPALFLLLSLLSACTRDHAELQPDATDISRLSFTEMAFQHPERFVDVLKKFSAQAKSVREKTAADQTSFPDTPVEDALALLEGTSHYDFLVRKNTLSSFAKKDLTLTVDHASSGMLSGTGLQNAYNQLYAVIQNEINQQPGRILFLIDVVVKENQEGSTELAVTVLTATNGITDDIPQSECGVQPNDYWRPGGDLGKCDDTQKPKDAADREMAIMNQPLCQPVCTGETETLWLLTIGKPFGYNDSPLGNLLWPMYGIGNNPTCLSPAQMQTNMNILNDIKNIYHPQLPNYQFSGAWVRSTEFTAGDQFYTYHDGIMFYVPKLCIPGNGDGGEP